jgi:hypothetical protein
MACGSELIPGAGNETAENKTKKQSVRSFEEMSVRSFRYSRAITTQKHAYFLNSNLIPAARDCSKKGPCI